MGYTTVFAGSIELDPPLSAREAEYLAKFSRARHGGGPGSPYAIEPEGGDHPGLLGISLGDSSPSEGKPSRHCHWTPGEGGRSLEWDGFEKFRSAPEWMAYLRQHFLTLNEAKLFDPKEHGFWERHEMSGTVTAVGEEANDDLWQLKADAEGIWTRYGEWTADALRDLFGHEPRASDDEFGEAKWEEKWTSPAEALAMLGRRPEMASWGPWSKVPDFADAAAESRHKALAEAREIELAAKRPAPGVARSRPKSI